MQLTISKRQARVFLLSKQLLIGRKLSGYKGIEKVFKNLRIIQFDPLNPCGRNPDLVLQSRVSNIHPEEYYRWLYKQRKGIEVYDKELSIIPIEDLPLTFHNFSRAKEYQRIKSFLKIHAKELEDILQKIYSDGPISSASINDGRKADSGWSDNAQWGRVALEILWRVGRLVIVRRDIGRKYYDLPNRAYRGKHEYVDNGIEITKEHVLRRIQSVGMLNKSGGGSGWLGMGSSKEVRTSIDALVKEEKLIEVIVDGVKRSFVIKKEDVEVCLRAKTKKLGNRMEFIAPLDNLIWDRKMVKEFFDFDYTWEVYVPQSKRKFGYYVLPILYKDKFIGRIEPVLNKKEKKLEIRGLWKEKEWDRKTEEKFQETLKEFRQYSGEVA